MTDDDVTFDEETERYPNVEKVNGPAEQARVCMYRFRPVEGGGTAPEGACTGEGFGQK